MNMTRTKFFTGGLLGLSILVFGSPASADSHGNKFVHSREFNSQIYVMYQDHMSLYTYAKDLAGQSNCYGACLDDWTPAILDADTKLGNNYTLIRRTDGSMQAAFRGLPLYLYSKDRKPGDIKGDGVDGMWSLARP